MRIPIKRTFLKSVKVFRVINARSVHKKFIVTLMSPLHMKEVSEYCVKDIRATEKLGIKCDYV
jgi:hypothetical protein